MEYVYVIVIVEVKKRIKKVKIVKNNKKEVKIYKKANSINLPKIMNKRKNLHNKYKPKLQNR
jgi:hypothetical protein